MLIDTIKMIDGAQVLKEDGVTKYVGASVYDIAGSTLSKPINSAVLMRFSVTRAFTVPSGFTGSFAESITVPTGSPVYLIKRNGSNVGKITFTGNAGALANDTETTEHSFAIGDILTVEAPATADATHDNLAWTISATLV